MTKENLKPVSTRLTPETLNAIDQFVAKRSYWKRNMVINRVLTAVFTHFEESDIYDMVRYYPQKGEEIECKFKIKRKLNLLKERKNESK